MIDKSELYNRSIDGVEIGWQKSSFSSYQGKCVEVAKFGDGAVAIRDSKFPGLGTLRYSADEWAAFVAGVQNNEF